MDLSREEVLKRVIPWETYTATKLINGTGLQLLRRYDHRQPDAKAALLDENGVAYVRLFVGILRDITKEETLEYVLALIEEMLSANAKRARLFHDSSFADEDVYYPFLRLLAKRNWFIQEKSCKILTYIIRFVYQMVVLVSASILYSHYLPPSSGRSKNVGQVTKSNEVLDNALKGLVDWHCDQLRQPSHPTQGIATAVSSLATLLREPYVRQLFVLRDGVQFIIPLISPASSQQYIQLLYEATLCMWLLSFNDAAIDAMGTTHALSRLVEVARTSTKEKVVRVAILALRNLSSKANFASKMVDIGLPKIIQSLKLQAWTDEDLLDGLTALEETLKASIKTLSSFDKYKQEVLSGNLDWSPVHKDLVFWRENVSKFEDHDFQVLRILVTLLGTSKDPKTLAVCCHDLSQFIQAHPSGRQIVLDMKAKNHVMHLMEHENPEVRREALLCVQKLLLRSKYASYLQS